MKLTKAQKLMVEDGFPPALFLTEEQRDAEWESCPPKAMGTFFDPKLEQQRELREQLKAEAQRIRIAKLLAGQARKASRKIDTRGKRWDSRRCKWVPIEPQEKRMKVDDDTSADKPATAAVATTGTAVAEKPDGGDATTKTKDQKTMTTKAKAKKAKANGKANGKARKALGIKPSGKGAPKKTRVDVTLATLKQWTSAEELAASFKKELGDGKLSTAKQAIHKVAVANKKKLEKKKDEERGTLYRYI